MEHLTPAQEHHVDGNNDDDNNPNVVRYHPLIPPPHHLYNHSWMDHRNDLHHHMDTDHSNNNNTHSYNTHKDQALLLDMHILQTLLHRNRSSHGRTLYYRRTKMALRQVHRTLFQSSSSSSSSSSNVTTSNHTHTLFHEWNQYYQNQLQQQIIRPLQKLQNATKHDDVIQPIIEKIFMEFTLPTSTTSTATITTTTTTSNQTQNIHNNRMLHRILYDITDCIGRIEYAYSAGRMEIARGFFLSILTIWMASLARIHVLLLQLQYTVIRQYAQYCSQQLRPAIQWIHNNSKDTMHSTITSSSIISNSRSNSSSANIPTLLEQVNYLQHDIFQPILSRIHQKLTRYQHSKAIQQQQQISSRTRPERTHSSLQSLGLVRATSRQRPGHRRTRGTNPLATVSDHDAVTVPVITATATTIASAATTLPSNNNDNDNNSNTNHEHEFDDDDDDEMDTMTAAHTFHPPMPGTKEPSFSTDNDAIRDDDDDDDDDIGILQYGSRHYDDNKRNHTDRTTGIGIDEWSSLDQNMKAVQQFQNQKKSRPKKPSRSDQKPSAVVAATPPHRRPSQPTKATTTTTTTTKKKRKRNRTGNDFFDELFRG